VTVAGDEQPRNSTSRAPASGRDARAVIIAVSAALASSPALAETLYCSTWQGIRTCSSPGGYVSHESMWNGITTGSDNQGDRWTSSRWQDVTTTTVQRPDR
jgi:hypothetical protein